MLARVVGGLSDEVVAVLRRSGARFAFLHGSRAAGTHHPGSDVDLAAWWPGDAPQKFEVDLPCGVDLMVLNGASMSARPRVGACRGTTGT